MKNNFIISEQEKSRILNLYTSDSKKGLSEQNTQSKPDFSSPEAKKYFEMRLKQYMEYPENIPNIGGSINPNITTGVKSFAETIKGAGRDTEGLSHIISKMFITLPNSFEFFKKYKEINGETLYEALKGEWFSGGVIDNIVSRTSNSFRDWCVANPKHNICQIKSENELKYGV
jgi:hypothetical protein